jgi:hypothetical protein
MNPLIEPISFLIGTWTGTGICQYPTMSTINYDEQLVITHPAKNQPILHLK